MTGPSTATTNGKTGGGIAPRLLLWLLVAAVVVAVGVLTLWSTQTPSPQYGIVLDQGSASEEFTLTGPGGQPVSLSDYRGKTVLLYFGYTFCPDVCPLTLGDISSALAQMDDGGESVQTVFVTLDPERDTAERLSQYLNFINKSFVGLTGTPEEVAEQASHFGVFYERREGSSPETYFVDHTSQVLVIDKDGYLRMIFPNGVNGEQMAADLSTLRN
jgi:protein SCO1/2